MSVPDISGKAIANLEIESLRHVAPTFHGDTLYGETTVLDKWESTSKDDRGVVHVETIGYNQDGKVVLHLPPQGDGAEETSSSGGRAARSSGPAAGQELSGRRRLTPPFVRAGGAGPGDDQHHRRTHPVPEADDRQVLRAPSAPRQPLRRGDVGRFSFYGMQGILLIYLYYSAAQGGLGISEATATQIVGAYGGGGPRHDRGRLARRPGARPERTLFYAAVVVMCGHIALSALPGLTGVTVGLILIALGSGGVKANASSLVGSLYAGDDERRDGGFSLFYMGINLGAFAGPLLTGLLQEDWGFHAGFALAAGRHGGRSRAVLPGSAPAPRRDPGPRTRWSRRSAFGTPASRSSHSVCSPCSW